MFDSVFRTALHRHLRGIRSGSLVLNDRLGTVAFGVPEGELRANVHVRHDRFYRRAVLGGGLGVAEAFIDGDWTSEDLTALLRVFIRNLSVSDRLRGTTARLRHSAGRLLHAVRRNTRRGAARNIRAHYDVGNDFFARILDPTMCYSSGIFLRADATLEEASQEKMDRLCRKLDLQPNDELLEIGSGWGGLAIHAAEHYGCRVTTTTISPAQFRWARQRIQAAGLSDRITVLLRDYRDLEGQFDKLVSVEMVEAVGHRFLDGYFRQCARLLRPDGRMALQGIVIRDQRFKQYVRSVDFIREYVFPGGCLPSIERMQGAVAAATDFRLVHLEDIGGHYCETLRRWRAAVDAQTEEILADGYNEHFLRLWHYYLSYCEAGFAERLVNNVQILLAKPGCRVDATSLRLRSAHDTGVDAGTSRLDRARRGRMTGHVPEEAGVQ